MKRAKSIYDCRQNQFTIPIYYSPSRFERLQRTKERYYSLINAMCLTANINYYVSTIPLSTSAFASLFAPYYRHQIAGGSFLVVVSHPRSKLIAGDYESIVLIAG